MDLLFVYDDKIAQDMDGKYYVGSAFSQEIFDRYFEYFDHIILMMRKAKIDPADRAALSKLNRLTNPRIDVVFYPDRRESLKSFLSPSVFLTIRRLIREQVSADCAVIIRVPSNSGTYAASCCLKQNKLFLAEAVGCPWDSLWNHSWKGKMLAFGAWLRMRYAMKHAPYAVYVTSEFLQRRYPTKGISAAISDVELMPSDQLVLSRRLEKIRQHSGVLKIATAGAVDVAAKGQQFVIQALAELKKRGMTNFEYHLAGGGYQGRLMEYAERLGVEHQVVFEGIMPHDQMFAWFDEMDLYIQPSLQDGLPRAVVEAMSRGLPVIGARTGGIPELLGDECIFPKRAYKTIADLLEQLSKEQMICMSNDNFAAVVRYQRDFLEQKRFEFYSAFAETVKCEH